LEVVEKGRIGFVNSRSPVRIWTLAYLTFSEIDYPVRLTSYGAGRDYRKITKIKAIAFGEIDAGVMRCLFACNIQCVILRSLRRRISRVKKEILRCAQNDIP
jgi:hypothetical protein